MTNLKQILSNPGRGQTSILTVPRQSTDRQNSSIQDWMLFRQASQSLANITLLALGIGVILLCSQSDSLKTSSPITLDDPRLRPAAYSAEEIFLPSTLIDIAKDESLHKLLQKRDTAKLDAFFDSLGLRNAWFVVKYRAIRADGITWKGTDQNFECKKYNVHTSNMEETENKLSNLEVLARVLAKASGIDPNSLTISGQAKDPTISTTHFDEAQVYIIPNDSMQLRWIDRNHIDRWRQLGITQTR